jgi:hypothetical protein
MLRTHYVIRMESYFEMCRNFKMSTCQVNAVKFYFILFYLPVGIIYYRRSPFQTTLAFCLELYYWFFKYLLELHIALQFIYAHSFLIYVTTFCHAFCNFIFDPVYSVISEMPLALQFERTSMSCPGGISTRLLAIMFEVFVYILCESRQIPGH